MTYVLNNQFLFPRLDKHSTISWSWLKLLVGIQVMVLLVFQSFIQSRILIAKLVVKQTSMVEDLKMWNYLLWCNVWILNLASALIIIAGSTQISYFQEHAENKPQNWDCLKTYNNQMKLDWTPICKSDLNLHLGGIKCPQPSS